MPIITLPDGNNLDFPKKVTGLEVAEKISKSLVTAAIIGSIAAACECEIDGNEPINSLKVLKKIDEIEKQLEYSV